MIILSMLNLLLNWFALFLLIAVTCSIFNYPLSFLPIAVVTTVIFLLTVSYYLSPIGEKSFLKSYRQLNKMEEKYAYPIFTEIYKKTGIKKQPVLLIKESNFPGASVVGNSAIILNSGLLRFATPEQLAAVIAHEFGHIKNGDSRTKLINHAFSRANNVVLSAAITILVFISDGGERGIFLPLIMLVGGLKVILLILEEVLLLGILAIDRKAEYQADAYAKELGHGHHLAVHLERTAPLRGTDARPFLTRTHPTSEKRIKKLALGSTA